MLFFPSANKRRVYVERSVSAKQFARTRRRRNSRLHPPWRLEPRAAAVRSPRIPHRACTLATSTECRDRNFCASSAGMSTRVSREYSPSRTVWGVPLFLAPSAIIFFLCLLQVTTHSTARWATSIMWLRDASFSDVRRCISLGRLRSC